MMTENSINKEDGTWTDSFTEDYIEIAEEGECCNNVHTREMCPILTLISVLVVGGICYVVVLYTK